MPNGTLRVINVLEHEFYNDCHIKGSVNVPLGDMRSYAQDLERTTPIVVYCANYTCSESLQAWQMLNEMGFSNVRAYEGGIHEWYKAELPIEGPCLKGYLQGPKEELHDDIVVKEIDMHTLYTEMQKAGLL
jgi:rhodanese-related sulfurtransferase